MNSARRLLQYLKPYWHQFTLGFLALLLVAAAGLSIPLIFRQVVELLLKNGNPTYLGLIMLAVVVLSLLRGLLNYAQRYEMAFVGNRIVANMRNQVFRHLQRMSLAYHEANRIGETVARVTNDVSLLQATMSGGAADLLYQAIFLVGIITYITILNWRLALLTLVIFPLAAWVISEAGTRIRGISHRVQERTADLAALLQELLSGIRIVKAFTLEEMTERRFQKVNEENFKESMRSTQIMAISGPLIDLVFTISLCLVLWYVGLQVLHQTLTVPDLFAYFTAVAMAGAPLATLATAYTSVQQALAAADRVFRLLDAREDVKDAPDALALPDRIVGRVEFQDVTFGYGNDQIVLAGINLEARPGEVVALVGPSGAGKTTLVNLIPRFYDPLEGRVLVDGYDLRSVRASSLRHQIGLVPQETILFGASVRENIAYGRLGAGEGEIIAAAKAANAFDFIQELPQGFDTILGERGATLSGGQRQRLAIARALLRDPRILILDEATSALDTESEHLVQEALENLMRERTTFVIAHRLSTIQFATKIVVLAGGAIVEQGTHEELLAMDGLYRRLYEKQFAAENADLPEGGETAATPEVSP